MLWKLLNTETTYGTKTGKIIAAFEMTDQSKRALVVGICDMRTPLTLKEIKTINELSIEVKRHNVMKDRTETLYPSLYKVWVVISNR